MGHLSATRRRGVVVVAAVFALSACIHLFSRAPEDVALEGWLRRTRELRDLVFLRSVELRWLDREGIPAVLRELIEFSYPPGYVEAYRDAYAALGVLPAGIDLTRMMVSLQQDQLIGLYSPRPEILYVVTDPSDDGFQSESTIVHELVHALQHQHFPRAFALQQGLRHNDDVLSAVASALEGDASLSMLGAGEADSGFQRDVASAEHLRDAMLLDLKYPSGMLADVPRLMRVSLLFPYVYGTPIAAHRFAAAGNRGLDALIREPPLSTLRVVHPEESAPVEFIRLPLQQLHSALEPEGCALGHHNVAGAMTIQVLFEDHGERLADEVVDALVRAWSGDRFLQVSCPAGWELLWFTRWRDSTAAEAFAERYRGIAASVARVASLSGEPEVQRHGRSVVVLTPGLRDVAALVRRESEIRAYDALPAWLEDDCFPESPCPESPG